MKTESLIEQMLSSENLNEAFLQVKRNKGAEGIDGMKVNELSEYLKTKGDEIKEQIRKRKYKPQAVRRVEIPKSDGGVRNLGVPTVTNELRNYGFKDVEDNLSITLGSLGVSLMEFSEAYSMFSNNGVQVKPYIIEQVINKSGQSVTFGSQSKPLMKPEQIYLMTSVLQDVVTKGT